MAEPSNVPSASEPAMLVAEGPQSPCLSDEDVLAFAVGRLESARLSQAHVHLDTCEICQRLLCEAAHSLATAATAPLSESEDGGWNTMFQPGALVGQRYLIRQFIARGGMGEVYEAFDRDLQERVALKTVTSTACDSPRAVRRLKGEVQLARRVSHPNVCRIYDLGSHQLEKGGAQLHFLTMEFVEGETLGQRVRLAGAVPIDEAQQLAKELLLGLSAAHDAGILHRDFKSDNVMLRAEPDGRCTPLILDFGLARTLDQEPKRGVSASNPTLVGTFGYIAPEQIEGKPLSAASDVYSFGVVWFEMLTGELPFEVGSSPAASALERLHRPAPPPSSVNPKVPSELDALVLRCLHRSPLERFKTAAEVLAAFQSLESRARPGLHGRRLVQLAIAACVGGLAAYWVAPSESGAEGSRSVETTHLAPPPSKSPPAQPTRTPSLVATPSEPSTEHANVALLPSASKRGMPQKAERPPSRVPPAGSARASATLPPALPPPSASVPALAPVEPAAPAPASPAPPASAKPDWENPFGAHKPSELRAEVGGTPT
jgi:serine/threonine protein kinase